MTPPHQPIRNVLTTRTSPLLERPAPAEDGTEQAEALTRLGNLGLFLSGAQEIHTTRVQEQAQAHSTSRSRDVFVAGRDSAQALILNMRQGTEPTAMEELFTNTRAQARGGDRRAYYDALVTGFVLIHRELSDGNRTSAAEHLGQCVQLLEQYREFLNHQEAMAPAERFRYLFAATRVARTLLGRVLSDAEFAEANEPALTNLRDQLFQSYGRTIEYAQQMRQAQQDMGPFGGIILEILLRQHLLKGNLDEARQIASQLRQYFTDNPVPNPLPEDPALQWAAQANLDLVGREELRSPEQLREVQTTPRCELEMIELTLSEPAPSSSAFQPAAITLNALGLDLLQVVAASIDENNEETEVEPIREGETETLAQRYQAFVAVASLLCVARPEAHLEQILQTLGSERNLGSITDQLEDVLEANSELAEQLQPIRGEHGVRHLVQRAQRAAAHVLELRRGPGDRMMGAILRYNQEALRPPEEEETPELAERLNGYVERLLENFATDIGDRPDHEVGALFYIFQRIADTAELAPGASLSEEHRNHARDLVTRMEGWEYRASRIWYHSTTAASLTTLFTTVLFGEFAEAALLYRAGTGGQLAFRGRNLVSAGRLTGTGTVAVGLGTGLAMSLVGAASYNVERAAYGLETHFWRDWGRGALLNSLTFGAMIPFSRGFANFLARDRSGVQRLNGLGFFRRVGLHLGNAAFGTTVGMGLNIGWRWATTGELTSSWDEVAENFISMLAYEGASASVRTMRRGIGMRSELRGRPLIEEIPAQEINTDGSITINPVRGIARIRNFLSLLGNVYFTTLGAARAQMVRSVAERFVQANPQLAPHTGFLVRRLAVTEVFSPGTLEAYMRGDYEVLNNYLPVVVGDAISPDIMLIPMPDTRWTPELAAQLRTRLELSTPQDRDYLLSRLFDDPLEVTEIGLNPETGQVVSIGHLTLTEIPEPVRVPAQYDGESGNLTFLPFMNDSEPVVWNIRPLFDAHAQAPHPYRWNHQWVLTRVVPRALSREELNTYRSSLSGSAEADVPMLFDAETGELLSLARVAAAGEQRPSLVRLLGHYEPESMTIRLPRPHGSEGEVILDLNTGNFTLREDTGPNPPPGGPFRAPPSDPPGSRDPVGDAMQADQGNFIDVEGEVISDSPPSRDGS